MEHRTEEKHLVLKSADALFSRLNEAGIRYGIFKSSRNIAVALAGDQDLDILVARGDYHLFCAIAIDCGGARSVNHPSLKSPGREDWFIPDFDRAKYLHLDVHTNIRLGGKFNKRYPFYSYDDISRWNMISFGTLRLRVASAEDEARVTLSRVAFRAGGFSLRSWQQLKGDWAEELRDLLFPVTESGEAIVTYPTKPILQCRVRRNGPDVSVTRRDLACIRRAVRAHCAATWCSALRDPILNVLKATNYIASRLANRISPGIIVDRRSPTSGGMIVAVVAPDGMGKTTQVRRLSAIFGWKFSSANLYLGSGDGKGWWIRRMIRSRYMRRRSIKQAILGDTSRRRKRPKFKTYLGTCLLELWGVLVALERYASVVKARRIADRGFIVFCDRWPQAIAHGFLDGPTQHPHIGTHGLLRKWELRLYDSMAAFQPDISIQLVGDHSLSDARKPGELKREDFDRRVDLMREIRKLAPRTHVIDAGGSIDDVSRSVFRLIWSEL